MGTTKYYSDKLRMLPKKNLEEPYSYRRLMLVLLGCGLRDRPIFRTVFKIPAPLGFGWVGGS